MAFRWITTGYMEVQEMTSLRVIQTMPTAMEREIQQEREITVHLAPPVVTSGQDVKHLT
jgi:hypothetical protein